VLREGDADGRRRALPATDLPRADSGGLCGRAHGGGRNSAAGEDRLGDADGRGEVFGGSEIASPAARARRLGEVAAS
jgi:hypothetical protein